MTPKSIASMSASRSIQVEIDGIRHQVDDWSVGGFASESVLTSRKPDERFWVRLIFLFEEFELTMRRERAWSTSTRDTVASAATSSL